MQILGTALLSLCVVTGLVVGRLAGAAFGLDSDLGGVGLAMILLILATDALRRRGLLTAATEGGVAFWGQIYVPIVVAMAASQNVRGALQGGWMAAFAGLAAVATAFLVMRLFGRGKDGP
ncbi:MAG: malonate transporter subunit MadL [Opitutales bacterium]|jgi:malonate transporter MadL subunit